MSRPRKQNADWFSHDAGMRNDPKIKALRTVRGIQGYAIWNMILETLTDSNNFEYEWNEISQEIMAGDFGVTIEELKNTINYCIKLGLLYIDDEEDEILCCSKLTERFTYLLSKREKERNKIIGDDIPPYNLIPPSENTIKRNIRRRKTPIV